VKRYLGKERAPLLATTLVALIMFFGAGAKFPGIVSMQVFCDILADNAFVGVIAVGLTFVILTGGIDLSVGAMVGCGSIMVATLMERGRWEPIPACLAVLAFGTGIGFMHGALIAKFKLPPFLVTLAGLFLCRGLALAISKESVQVAHPTFVEWANFRAKLPMGGAFTVASTIFLVVLAVGIFIGGRTRFGRAAYAIGGSEKSASLMGIPVDWTVIRVYALSGFCSALGGVVFAVYTSSGNAASGTGTELDAIAAVVIGGALLSGGYGSVIGSFLGVFILGVVQVVITFDGTLSSWWTKIVVGVLLLIFILIQKAIETAAARTATSH